MPKELIIISGRSGSGKSTALNVLEDLGYFPVDNMPVTLLPQLIKEVYNEDKIAIGVDIRAGTKQLEQFPTIVDQLSQIGLDIDVIFLDAKKDTLLKRYSETRRKHPMTLNKDNELTLSEAIDLEFEITSPIARIADIKIDTSNLNLHELRDRIKSKLLDPNHEMTVLFESFGFKHGALTTADLVFDVRCLPNPHWIPDLRSQTGQDEGVANYLSEQADVQAMIEDISVFLTKWLPQFKNNNRSYMTVGIGCTGGQHRSVFITEALFKRFQPEISSIQIRHRELSK